MGGARLDTRVKMSIQPFAYLASVRTIMSSSLHPTQQGPARVLVHFRIGFRGPNPINQ